MRRPRLIRNGWFATRYLLGSSRLTFPLLHLAPAPYAREMVDASKRACIEGFPRSANTLAVLGFWKLNPGTPLAHHVHVPAQVERAVRARLPTAILIREPVETLASLALFADDDLSARLSLLTYLHFHRRIWAARDRVALCDFDQVIADPAVVPRRLNELFGTRFRDDPMSPAATRELVLEIEQMHRDRGDKPGSITVPSGAKEQARAPFRERLAAEPLLDKADSLYRLLRKQAG